MTLFKEKRDYEKFLNKLFEYKLKYNVELLTICLMPNHFHLLVRDLDESGALEVSGVSGGTFVGGSGLSSVSKLMQCLLNSYAHYFICKYKHSGAVFQGRFQSKIINSESYFLQVQDYIMENPVRKGLVKKREEWPYSTRCLPAPGAGL